MDLDIDYFEKLSVFVIIASNYFDVLCEKFNILCDEQSLGK